MKTFIYPEMMVHVPMCTHKNPKSVLVSSDKADLLGSELARYRDVEAVYASNAQLLDTFRNAAEGSADVVILDALCDDAAALAHLNRVLKDDGLCVLRHPDMDELEANTKLMQILGNYFKIIMPYTVGDGTTLLLCSKEYHPTADLILQRSDLLEGQSYYNCDIHTAAFAMPQYIRKNYLGIIRN
ncbi:MAG: spermidine synthase [Campylobacterota bacterium]